MESEPVFLNVYGAQESIPRNRFRQPMQPGGPVRQIGFRTGSPGRESMPGLLKRSTNTGSGCGFLHSVSLSSSFLSVCAMTGTGVAHCLYQFVAKCGEGASTNDSKKSEPVFVNPGIAAGTTTLFVVWSRQATQTGLLNPHQNDQGRKGPCFIQRLIALKCLKCQKIKKNI